MVRVGDKVDSEKYTVSILLNEMSDSARRYVAHSVGVLPRR